MSLFGMFERRSPENPAQPLTSATLLDWMSGPTSDAGVAVTEQSAMTMAAVYRCVSLVSAVAAALPLHTYANGTKDPAAGGVAEDPHPDLTPYEYWRLTYVHRLLWGNHVSRKHRDRVNRVRWLEPLPPDTVTIERVRPTELNPAGKRFRVVDEWGGEEVLAPFDVLHLPGLGYDGVRGYSPVRLAHQTIGLALAAERHGAKLFGSGNMLSGLIRTDQQLDHAKADAIKQRWKAQTQGPEHAHDIAVLGSGAQFQSLTMPNDDAEFLASRRFQVSEVARWYGVPPSLLMETERQTSWGTAIEQQAIGWVKFDLHPQWLAPTEQRVTKELLPGGRYAKYVIEGLLRGDSASRAEFYRTMREVGAFSADDIRELEDRPPIPGGVGGSFLQPMNMVPLGTGPVPSGTGQDNEGTGDAPQQPSGQ